MTDDEFKIQETRAMSAREVRKILHDERMREVRRTSGITEEILKASTTGGGIVAMQIGEAPRSRSSTWPSREFRTMSRRPSCAGSRTFGESAGCNSPGRWISSTHIMI